MKKKLAIVLTLIFLMLVLCASFTACQVLDDNKNDGNTNGDTNDTNNDITGDNPTDDENTTGDNDNNSSDSTTGEDVTDNDVIKDQTEEFSYLVENGTATITKYLGNASHVMIPDTINGYPVKQISAGAFVANGSTPTRQLRRASSEENNNDSEDEKEELEQNQTIYIPGSIDTIEDGAFDNQNNFYVTDAAQKPEGWKDSTLSSGQQTESSGGNMYFESVKEECVVKDDIFYTYDYHQQGYFVVDCFNGSTEIKLPNNIDGRPVNNIGARAFKNCTNLKKITLSKDITYVWTSAFENCTSLEEVVFNSPRLAKILIESFAGCTSLKKVVLPENLIFIHSYAFENCGAISEMTIPATLVEIAPHAFLNTTVEKINYGSTEETFGRIRMHDNEEMFHAAEIVYSENTIIDGITKIKDLKNLETGTVVAVRGYVACYLESKKSFLLIDEKNEYGIVIYMQVNDDVGYLPNQGDYVEVSGSVTVFSSMLELSYINSITKLGEETLTPHKVSVHELNQNPAKFLYKYIEVELTVTLRDSYYTYFEGLDFYYFNRSGRNPLSVGDTVIIKGTITEFGTILELESHYENLTIVNKAEGENPQ